MNPIEIQYALLRRGFYTGSLDGQFGPQSIAAVKAFQLKNGLDGSGTIGPKTTALLRQPLPEPVAPAWLKFSGKYLGLKEAPGKGNNPTIMSWAKGPGGWGGYTGDDVPWCGLFVGHVMGTTLPQEPLVNPTVRASAWSNYGQAVRPCLGAILVFQRPGGGHVCFYQGEDATTYYCFGGNQGDQVSLIRIAKDRLQAARWPRSQPVTTTPVIYRGPGAALSQNEA